MWFDYEFALTSVHSPNSRGKQAIAWLNSDGLSCCCLKAQAELLATNACIATTKCGLITDQQQLPTNKALRVQLWLMMPQWT